ncbi:MAG: NfeD family protein [Bacillota bacterium]|nr:NfeD family protein [Bacillota bacterium]
MTITPLRPAGTVEFPDGDRLDVVTEGSFINSNFQVKVVKVEGTRVLVREVKKDTN